MPRAFWACLIGQPPGSPGNSRGAAGRAWRRGWLLLGWLGLLSGGCSAPHGPAAETAAPLGTGHFEGRVELKSGPVKSFKLALELRHPRAGHYEAEVVAPSQPSLSFVADSVDYQPPTLRLTRPGRPGQRLTLARDGDFWRGTLTLDSAAAPVLLVRRGAAEPASYRVRRLGQGGDDAALGAGALLFAPADESTAGPALALLPAATHAALAARWADELARAGIIVLLLPPLADTIADITAAHDLPAVQAALRRLRATPGADTARLGVWATAGRAARLLPGLTGVGAPRPAFLIMQQLAASRELRSAVRSLRPATPVLGLYAEGPAGSRRDGPALRAALGRRGGSRVRVVPAAEAGAAVAEWLGAAGP